MSLELRSVTLVSAQNVFGIFGTQLAQRMMGIHLTYVSQTRTVVVTSDQHLGKQEWILTPMIGKLVWVDPELEERR